MKYSPVVTGKYWLNGEKYVGPPHLRGREALLARHRRTVAIIRTPLGVCRVCDAPVRLQNRGGVDFTITHTFRGKFCTGGDLRAPRVPRNHRFNPVQKWERRWFGTADGRLLGCMTLLGVEGAIYKKWRRLRDLWIAGGCVPNLRPWFVWGDGAWQHE